MATTDEQSADARLAKLRRDPDVIVRERTNHGPLEPAFALEFTRQSVAVK
jgi:hypothetical protein